MKSDRILNLTVSELRNSIQFYDFLLYIERLDEEFCSV